jgi:hypothetical protein
MPFGHEPDYAGSQGTLSPKHRVGLGSRKRRTPSLGGTWPFSWSNMRQWGLVLNGCQVGAGISGERHGIACHGLGWQEHRNSTPVCASV